MDATRPPYLLILWTMVRNSIIRAMSFRFNFLAECTASLMWMVLNLGFYILIFEHTGEIAPDSGWTRYPYFIFLATVLIVQNLIGLFVAPNLTDFSELIRTGGLDFLLIKPIDTQFLASFNRCEWGEAVDIVFGVGLLVYALFQLDALPAWWQMALYPFYVFCGAAILYSFMLGMTATSVWLGRHQSLADFWFYLTTFARQPWEIFAGPVGSPLRWAFTWVFPVLISTNIPARLLARPLTNPEWQIAGYTVLATVVCLLLSRWWFLFALKRYRSASS